MTIRGLILYTHDAITPTYGAGASKVYSEILRISSYFLVYDLILIYTDPYGSDRAQERTRP